MSISHADGCRYTVQLPSNVGQGTFHTKYCERYLHLKSSDLEIIFHCNAIPSNDIIDLSKATKIYLLWNVEILNDYSVAL